MHYLRTMGMLYFLTGRCGLAHEGSGLNVITMLLNYGIELAVRCGYRLLLQI